jgi:hypothetical protein
VRQHREGGAVLVVRAWVEPEEPREIRARILTHVEGRDVTIATARSIEEVCAVVERWLRQVQRDATELRDS